MTRKRGPLTILKRTPAALIFLILIILPELNLWRIQLHFEPPRIDYSFDLQQLNGNTDMDNEINYYHRTQTDGNPLGKRVAIVIAGSLERFMLTATIEHLLRPLVAQHHAVDFYLSLQKSLRQPNPTSPLYPERLHWDPLFSNYTVWTQRAEDPLFVSTIRRTIAKAGGRLRHLSILNFVDLDTNELLRSRRAAARQLYPKEDPDLRFPLLDIRTSHTKERTTAANRNMLRLAWETYQQWQFAQQVETNLDFQYDYFLFLRDDTLWLRDFDFDQLLASAPSDTELFVLACDARDPPLHEHELSDHGVLVTRQRAPIFGAYYTELFAADLSGCAERLGKKLTKGGQRGCNGEMILKWIVDEKNLKVYKADQSEMPFQRGLNVIMPPDQIEQCLHKTCQSRNNPLSSGNIRACSELDRDIKKITR